MAQAAGADLERILDGPLPPHASAQGSHDPAAPIDHEGPPNTDAAAPPADCRPQQSKRFNPLGNKPRKRSAQRAAAEEPGPEQFQASLDGLAAAMEQMLKGDAGAPESSENVQATLQRVNEAARAAAEGSTGQAADSSPADADDGQAEVQKMLDAMSRAMEGDGEDANSLVETLMHGLLSKEVLLDPLKDISERYPAWIESNRPLLSGEEVSRYEEQLEHIHRVCDLLETHGDSRFDELLQLLQELQAMGQPPQELLQQMQATSGGDGGLLADDLPQCPIQ